LHPTDFAAIVGLITEIEIYVALPDPDAEAAGDIRVLDESGEDYLFSARRFVAVELPQAVRASVRRAS
jgi:hypothetical protein